jgi:hypothetical protein
MGVPLQKSIAYPPQKIYINTVGAKPLVKFSSAGFVGTYLTYYVNLLAGKLLHGTDKVKTLMARWRYPSLSLHGIHGAFSDNGAKTVIPRSLPYAASFCKIL